MTRRLGFAAAAKEIGCSESWLRKNSKRLPKSKVGGRVYFTDADLERIDALFHLEPEVGPLARAAAPVQGGPHPMAHLKPLPARSRAAHAG